MPTLRLGLDGRFRNAAGKFVAAPLATANGRFRDANTGRYVTVTLEGSGGRQIPIGGKSPITPTAVKVAAAKVSEEIAAAKVATNWFDKTLPPLKPATNEAAKFKQGVVNMGVVVNASAESIKKLRSMDAVKLLELYHLHSDMFDWYFAYEGETAYDDFGYEGEGDAMTHVIDLYERTYNVKL